MAKIQIVYETANMFFYGREEEEAPDVNDVHKDFPNAKESPYNLNCTTLWGKTKDPLCF